MDLSHWIAHWAAWSPERVALNCDGRALTYAALDQRVRRLATMLRDGFGVGPGERVAHLGYNSPELVELLFACARIGAVLVPLNWRLAPPEHAWILEDSAPRLLLSEPAFMAAIGPVLDGLPEIGRVAYGGAAGWQDYEALLARTTGAAAPAGGPGSPVMLVYTSGTTGRPKGAVLPQRALLYNALNAVAAYDMSSADHVLTVLPMFHVGGMNIQTTPALYCGGTVTLLRRFDPGECLRAIATARPSMFLTVPATTLAMINHSGWAAADLSSLRMAGTGSTTVPEAMIRPWHERGVPVSQVYGLTESGPVAVCLPLADAERKIGSCGLPCLHTALRIADDDGTAVAPGTRGEILLRGPNLLSAYWNNAEATAEAFAGGWFHTGDVGHVDADGYLTVDDRKKDVVISGGENVYPAELENVLAGVPGIAEAAVVGRPDARWGEVPVAVVVRRPGSMLQAADVLALFRGRLARYKHPHEVCFVEALPRNVMGKVLKYELRAQLTDGGERR